ncbi:transcriptional regulator [Vibrio parahaemolyticus]|uniref:phage repressor protein CI n=1 Tax=Vibrio TaxID=662 RepID=UPI001A8F9835|nr:MULTISPECIES: phage repressor protein CI [Vibrio]EGQ7973558.1 transcriptional regulator [Vibrio parahaemolyticus]MBO0208540.1 phage repressor protein CI [Vibrio sp. Vb0877]MCR9809167.1 helix-turn-helix domain-containing protein [Vibrio parahaemolyticus]
MKTETPRIPKPDYGNASDFIGRLKVATGIKRDGELAEFIGKPVSTIATWKTKNRINHEAMVFVHLSTGASIPYLALGKGDPFPNGEKRIETSVFGTQQDSLVVHKIQNGELTVGRSMTIGRATLNDFNLTPEHLTIVDHKEETLFIDRQEHSPNSGRYLVAIDGVFGVYDLQRIPNDKVEIQLTTSSRDLNLSDLLVVGKVKMAMRKR